MSQQPPIPLDQRVRRRILRRLHRDFAPRTAGELSEDLGVELGEIRYHCEVLTGWRIVKQTQGPSDFLFESSVAEDPEVIALLIATKAEDEPK